MSDEREYPGDPFPPEQRERLISLLLTMAVERKMNDPLGIEARALAESIKALPKRSNPAIEADEMSKPGSHELSCWFGLSYAGFLIIPRVLMEAMPDEWQGKMAALLNAYSGAWSCANLQNTPLKGLQVRAQFHIGNKLVSAPPELCNYRRPDRAALEKYR